MATKENTSNELGSIANSLNQMAAQLSGISATARLFRDYGDAIEGSGEAIGLIVIPEILGKEYRQALRDLGLGDPWLQALNKSVTGFNMFKTEHAAFLNTVRTYVGAHKEKDALAQLAVLEALDHMEIYRLGAKFSASLTAVLVGSVSSNWTGRCVLR